LSFGVNILVTILLTPFLLHYLGQPGYGLWVTLSSLLAYLGLLDLGLSTTSIKFIAEYRTGNDPDGLNVFISTVFVTYLILGSVVFALSMLISFYLANFFQLPPDLAKTGRVFFLLAGVNLALSFPLSPLNGILFSHQRIDVLNLTNTLVSVCYGLFSILVLNIGLGLVGMAWVALGINLLSASFKWSFIRRRLSHVRIRPVFFNRKVLKTALTYAFYLLIMSAGAQIVFNTDNIIISQYLGIAAVTAYAVAFRLIFTVMQLIFKIADVFAPVFSELHALKDAVGLRSVYLESSKMSVAVAVPVAIILIVSGEGIIRLWVGAGNFVGMPALLALVALTFMHSFVHPGAVMLSSIGRTRGICFFNMAEAVLNLSLSIILVKYMDVLGVVLGTLCALALTNLWYIPASSAKEVGLSLRTYIQSVLLRPVSAGLPAIGVATALRRLISEPDGMMLATFSLTVFVVYLLAFWSFGVTGEERSLYHRRFRSWVKNCTVTRPK
jgi:O-antigen/teichoic acid export membrane protein